MNTQTKVIEGFGVIEDAPGANVPAVVTTPMNVLDKAITSGASVDVIARLMELQERWEKNQARKAFDKAMAAAKAEIPVIRKNKLVDFESKRTATQTNYMHEDLAEIARTIDPILGKYGLSYRFNTITAAGAVTVVCKISHDDGHYEENPLTAPVDLSGNKNPIQAIGSTVTYLQRYTLKAALGLAAAADDDAQAVSEKKEKKQAPPIDRKEPLPTKPHTIPVYDGMKPSTWAEKYKESIRTSAGKPKELAEWAQLNARALSLLGDPDPGRPQEERMEFIAIRQEVDELFAALLKGEAPPEEKKDAPPIEWRRQDIEGALSAATFESEIEAIERQSIKPYEGKVPKEEWEAVQLVLEEARKRVLLET